MFERKRGRRWSREIALLVDCPSSDRNNVCQADTRVRFYSHDFFRIYGRMVGRMARSWIVRLAGVAIGSCGTILYLLNDSVNAFSPREIELPNYPWQFNRFFHSLDHAAVRRGWQVYRSVCSTCHSLQFVRFMDLVEETHTAEEARAIAEEYEMDDGPDEEGNYYKRPGKLLDSVPSPFPNEEAARFANAGSYPPDLTYMVFARRNGFNHLFAYLTGWREAPAGVRVGDTQSFNPYFPGCVTGMSQVLFDGMIEYEDGTPATESQMAKDVVEFLTWTASPEHDTKMLMLVKICGVLTILTLSILDIYRRQVSHIKSRRISYMPKRTC